MDLKLLTQLADGDNAYMILQRLGSNQLRYIISTADVGYKIYSVGTIPGDIPEESLLLTVYLGSIQKLVAKGYQMNVDYSAGELVLKEENDKFSVKPLSVPFDDVKVRDSMSQFIEFYGDYLKASKAREELESAEEKLKNATEERKQARLKHMTVIPESPFGDGEPVKFTEESDENYAQLESKVAQLKDAADGLPLLDMESLRQAAIAASKFGESVDIYDGCAVIDCRTAYMFVKNIEGNKALPGYVLAKLFNSEDANSSFFEYKGTVVFKHQAVVKSKGKPQELSETFVFLTDYLPNAKYSTSMITKGVVEEKYTVDISGVLDIINTAATQFPVLKLDLGAAEVILSNDMGEEIRLSFPVGDAQSIQLNRIMHGESDGHDLSMAVITVPDSVRRILSMFKQGLTIYIKRNKVVFNTDDIWVVFARE